MKTLENNTKRENLTIEIYIELRHFYCQIISPLEKDHFRY